MKIFQARQSQAPDSVVRACENRSTEFEQTFTDYYNQVIAENKDNMLTALLIIRAQFHLDFDFTEEFLKDYRYADIPMLKGVSIAIAGNKNKKEGTDVVDFEINDIEGNPRHFADYIGKGNYTLAGYAQHRHPLSRRHSLGTEICGQDRYADPECGGQSEPAQKEQLSAGLSLGGGDAEDV